MNLELLFDNIKLMCEKNNMNISQLERKVNFSTGSIGKWKSSAPSIEKVFDVAKYFRVSLDQLCGSENDEIKEESLIDRLILYNENDVMEWFLCLNDETIQVKYHQETLQDLYDEIYMSKYKKMGFYICKKYDTSEIIDLYLSLDYVRCRRELAENDLLQKLWTSIHKKEDEVNQCYEEAINEFMMPDSKFKGAGEP